MIPEPAESSPLTFVIGCTGCGKGALGRVLAERTNAEIVSADSMKVYRRMDIGTAKPSGEIRRQIPHHLIDVVEPCEEFSVARYVELAEQAIANIHARSRQVLVVGGTPMYIKALTEGLFEGPSADTATRERLIQLAQDEGNAALHARLTRLDDAAARRIHPNDRRRLVRALEVIEITGKPISALQQQWDRERRFSCNFVGLRRTREDQHSRTNARARRMIEQGLVEEVKSLLDKPAPLSETARKAVGYAEIIEHLAGQCSLDEAIEKIKINTRRLAKSQRTWFRRFRDVQWVDLLPDDNAAEIAERLLGQGVLAVRA